MKGQMRESGQASRRRGPSYQSRYRSPREEERSPAPQRAGLGTVTSPNSTPRNRQMKGSLSTGDPDSLYLSRMRRVSIHSDDPYSSSGDTLQRMG